MGYEANLALTYEVKKNVFKAIPGVISRIVIISRYPVISNTRCGFFVYCKQISGHDFFNPERRLFDKIKFFRTCYEMPLVDPSMRQKT